MQNLFQRSWWNENRYTIAYSIFIMVAGTLLHFVYDWSGQNMIIALFAAVSESIWEHLKLFFVPAFFFTLFNYCIIGEKYPDYLWYQTKSIISGLLFIVILFFTYSGITRQEWIWADISIFYLSAVIAGIVSGRGRKQKKKENLKFGRYTGVILLLLWALFIWFTYCIPEPLLEWMPGLFLSET